MLLLNWLFPLHCIICNTLGAMLCRSCELTLTPWENDLSWPLKTYPSLKHVYSAVEYRDTAPALIQQVKYAYYWRYTELWARLIFRATQPFLRQHRITALVPVPQHPQHFLSRGFHPTRQLARSLSQLSGIPAYPKLLQRKGSDTAQASRAAQARTQTLFEFSLRPGQSIAATERICLLDDVCTTGTTLSGCAKALSSAGLNFCIGATVARTP